MFTQFKMGHDIDIIDIKNNDTVAATYITGNFSKYSDKYQGIYHIHGHKNTTVIKILKRTLNMMLNDGIVPAVHNPDPSGRALTFGDKDPEKDLQCYAACLQEFLQFALDIKGDNLYWYSDQVSVITKFSEDGYESDGVLINNS